MCFRTNQGRVYRGGFATITLSQSAFDMPGTHGCEFKF